MQVRLYRTFQSLFSFNSRKDRRLTLHRVIDEHETLVFGPAVNFPHLTLNQDRNLQRALDDYFSVHPNVNSLIKARQVLAQAYKSGSFKSPRAAFINFLYHWQRHTNDPLNKSEITELIGEFCAVLDS